MSLNIIEVQSEAPHQRDEGIRRVLDGLSLRQARLSRYELERVVLSVAAHPELYQDLIVDDGASRTWTLFHSPSFEVKLLTWDLEQPSDWHDHAGSSGVFAVTRGVVTERHRADDHVSIETRSFGAGQFRSFGPDHVHDVVSESGLSAASIHAYSPPLSGLTYYDRTDYGFVAREYVPNDDHGAPRAQQFRLL
jgi:hypothetical protein